MYTVGCMYSMSSMWLVKDLAEFVLIGAPSGFMIWFWRRRKLRSKISFYACLSNLTCYLLWFMTVVAMFVMQEIPSICSVIDYRFPRYVFVFVPIIFAVGSIPLCILGVAAEEGERRFPVLINGLMFILWACMVVPPN